METRLRTGSCFYSTCLSLELKKILPNLINSTPGSSVNFHLVDVFAKSCVSSNNLVNVSYSNFIFTLREVGTKERLWHFVIVHYYAVTKPDSFSNMQIRKICFQKYNTLSQYIVTLNTSPSLLFWSSKSTFVPQKKQSVLKLKDCSVLRLVIELFS